jgi:hypothetical protein
MVEATDRRPQRRAALRRPGLRFWVLLAAGAAARAFLAIASEGSEDAELRTVYAGGVSRHGVIRFYGRSTLFNHPPTAAYAMARLWELSDALGWQFRAVFRLAVSAADMASALLILRVLRESPWRFAAAGAYAVAPIAIVLAGQHGNTDPLIALGLLGCVLLAARGRPAWTGALIGVCAWIKLPGLLAAPAIALAFARWRDRALCALVAAHVIAAPFLPAIRASARLARERPKLVRGEGNPVWERVFRYEGLAIGVPGDPAQSLWGLRNFLVRAFGPARESWPSWAAWWSAHQVHVALALVVAFALLRRRERTASDLAVTIAGAHAIFYALVDNWATQYFAWSMPFWLLAGPRFAVASNVIAGAFVWSLYAFVTDDWLLRGRWNYWPQNGWPAGLYWLRDHSLACFLAFGAVGFARALASEWRAWRDPHRRAIDGA